MFNLVSQKGWECPRCGRVNAPWSPHCDCKPGQQTLDENEVLKQFKQYGTAPGVATYLACPKCLRYESVQRIHGLMACCPHAGKP